MTNIKLRFTGLGYGDICQAKVCVCDECNNLIYEGFTCNGEVNLCLCENQLYKVYACTRCDKLFGVFYARCNRVYVFNFKNSLAQVRNNLITFLLSDFNYENLPIERGEINLWQRQ